MTPDKDFFPDTWSENQVINAIKQAWENKAPAGGNKYDGTYNGITIRMFIENYGTPNERIISAFPQ